ncbi:cation transporter [Sulfitobacter sp. KE29]|jgi:cobalt-zinc-cadmium efflux system protein|uniref:Cation efflux family protein n=1 Tax=Sulfitobacter delicatus TaxID=218672 RepID=A0A1G7WKM4_9RHOB|nr:MULTISPECIES: cation transporter [Sulfitobacter]MBO9440197.1 cation transporter [Sulfitobacter sp. R18_2]MDF3419596.1 cation transporter [Sulfitobacter sp. Ks38]MDF3427078.1 cation transporter [Sulfitobacter sp. KE29]MDF3430660.1 cation transporter [Sulfitobacter sp. S46]MDF3445432.1 cation transporter [Sulfitobacter sp. KE31]
MVQRQDASERSTLWIVLGLNIGLAVAFFASGAFGDSSALIANGLDNLSDSFVYAISLLALSRSAKWKRGAANVSGGLLILFALGILYDAWRRYVDGSDPLGTIMIVMALIAAAINALCVWLLARIRDPDVNIRAANTFSWNDFAANLGIVVGGGVVAWLGTNWPDLVVGVIVAGIAAWGGVGILRDAHGEHHKAVHDDGKASEDIA